MTRHLPFVSEVAQAVLLADETRDCLIKKNLFAETAQSQVAMHQFREEVMGCIDRLYRRLLQLQEK